MRRKFKVHLTSGTTITFKADDFHITYDADGNYTKWSADRASRWIVFTPNEIVAVERVRWFK